MLVTCKLNNGSQDYEIITLRNFYQVIFWEKDLKTLNIYTAVSADSQDKNNVRNKITSSYDLEFTFTCDNATISFFNKSSSFDAGTDTEAWQAVWGSETKKIDNYLQIGKIGEVSKAIINTNENFFKEDKKYNIKTDTDLNDGIGIVDFTLTTITFINKDEHLSYAIEFGSNQNFNAMDNSIYFILPEGYDIKPESKSGKIDDKKIDSPFQTMDHTNGKYIQEWVENDILKRKYFRPIDRFKSFSISKDKKFQFSFSIFSIINPIVNQLLLGFLVALFFSYGSDETRLMNFRSLFVFYDWFPPDMNFFLTYSLLFMSFLFRVSKGNTSENVCSYMSRLFAILVSAFWFFWMFIYPNPQIFYGSASIFQPNPFDDCYITISHFLNVLAFLSNSVSLWLICKFHKSEIGYSLLKQLEILYVFNNNK